MTLEALIAQYIAFRTARGEDFASPARVLRHFSRMMGTALDADAVQPEQVKAFLDGTRPLSRYWHRKYSLLQGFYQYALARGLVASCPLPAQAPKRPPALTPYIYTHDELRRLLEATTRLERAKGAALGRRVM